MQHLTRPLVAALALVFASRAAAAQDHPPAPTELDTRGLVLHEEGAFDGYTFLGPLSDNSVLMLDMEGEVAHRWSLTTGTECVILLDNGNLLRWGLSVEDGFAQMGDESRRFHGPGVAGGLVEEVDWDGNSIWRFVLDDDYQLLHHDIALLPNGNVLFLAWEHRYQEDAIEAGRDPAQLDERGMWPDAIYELKPPREAGSEAELVWEWHAWDHLVQDFDESKSNYGSVPDSPGRIDINAEHRGRPPLSPDEIAEREELEAQMAALGYGGEDDDDESPDAAARQGTAPDWLHTNAIDHLPEFDLLVISSPNMNELFVLDHSTTTEQAATNRGGRWGHGGEILWRWGNPRNYGAGDAEDQLLSFQHDPTWIAGDKPGELRILVFNNGRVRHGAESYSSADELVLPFDPERGFTRDKGKPFGPAAPVWSYSDPGTMYSSFISGAQRLPNGNTLICSGAQGRILEVTRDGKVVWDYRNPHVGESIPGVPANALYRAVRVAREHPGLAGREL